MSPESINQVIARAATIPGMFWPAEMVVVNDLFRDSGAHVEVGSFCGRSLYVTAAGMRAGTKVIAVDTFGQPMCKDITPTQEWWQTVFNATANAIRSSLNVQVEVMPMRSTDAARKIEAGTIDSVFIDGNHQKQFVLMDIEYWWPALRVGGIMAGHDYCPRFPGVEDAVQEKFPSGFKSYPNTRIWSVVKQSEDQCS